MPKSAAARIKPDATVPASHDHRRHPRYTVQYQLRYSVKVSGKTVRGGGMLVDVSQEGCGIQGSVPVKQGDRLTLEINVGKNTLALRLEGVVVMWASGSRFGVKSDECCKILSQLNLLPAHPQ